MPQAPHRSGSICSPPQHEFDGSVGALLLRHGEPSQARLLARDLDSVSLDELAPVLADGLLKAVASRPEIPEQRVSGLAVPTLDDADLVCRIRARDRNRVLALAEVFGRESRRDRVVADRAAVPFVRPLTVSELQADALTRGPEAVEVFDLDSDSCDVANTSPLYSRLAIGDVLDVSFTYPKTLRKSRRKTGLSRNP